MLDPNKILELNEEYNFNVKVKDGDQLLAGELFLSPKECTLLITSERGLKNISHDSEYIECHSLNHYFFLFKPFMNLIGINSLDNNNEQINHLKCKFKIEFIICFNTIFTNNKKYFVKGFTIDSPAINKWLMYTTLQDQLLNPYGINQINLRNISTVEFSQPISNYGAITIYYRLTIYSDPDSLQAGIQAPSRLNISFENPISMEYLHKEIDKIYNLMTLFIGSDFNINTIELNSNFKSSCYFPRLYEINDVKSALLPLARKLNHNHTNLKEIPLDSFNNYYQLSSGDQLLFTRYLRYTRMKSNEEKFLGYFRLLESLTYKKKPYVDENSLKDILNRSRSYLAKKLHTKNGDIKDLASRVMKVNESKYNTTKCLEDFYVSIPTEIHQNLSFQKSDIKTICKLRNDITHANEYTIDDQILYKYTVFINALLFLALTQKIGIPFDVCIPIVRGLERV